MTATPGRLIVCTGAKGGQGTTTIAAAIALTLARDQCTVLVDTNGDALPLLGCPAALMDATLAQAISHATTVIGGLQVATTDVPLTRRTVAIGETRERGWHVVIDGGVDTCDLADDAERILVVRNCYVALRRAVVARRPDRVVLIVEPHRSLSLTDAELVLAGVPIIATALDPAVARAVDAGLLAARLPDGLANAAASLLAQETPA